jgi:hypothetical protein
MRELRTQTTSIQLFDFYSITHLFWPFFIVLTLLQFPIPKGWIFAITLIITTLFEVLENKEWFIDRYRLQEKGDLGKSNYFGDSRINIFGDILSNLAGMGMAYYLPSNTIKIAVLYGMFAIITWYEPTYWKTFFAVMDPL